MKFTYYEIKKLPIVQIDDYYDQSECSFIWNELCFLNNRPGKLDFPLDSGTAIDPITKKSLKKNTAIFLDKIYGENRAISDILTENRKIFSENVMNELENLHSFFKYIKSTRHDTTLISYYENSDHYKPHRDEAVLTLITWFYKQPKVFTGGELIIEENLKIDCEYNRTVILPSIFLHEVLPISMKQEHLGINYGRYAITQFLKA